MITLINTALKQDLSYIKYSTPISGKGVGNKVLLFGFKDKAIDPHIVIKTVRREVDAKVIKEGFDNLKLLNQLTDESEFDSVFPKALMFFKNHSHVWSAESYCTGVSSRESDIQDILNIYNEFSLYIVNKNRGTVELNYEYCSNLIKELNGKEEDVGELMSYGKLLWNNEHVVLPSVLQHGDLTLDNIRKEKEKFKIIDCDIFGTIKVPGYDIYHLLCRNKKISICEQLVSHFEKMNIDYVPDKKILFVYFLHELFIKRDYILGKKSVSEIITSFEDNVS